MVNVIVSPSAAGRPAGLINVLVNPTRPSAKTAATSVTRRTVVTSSLTMARFVIMSDELVYGFATLTSN